MKRGWRSWTGMRRKPGRNAGCGKGAGGVSCAGLLGSGSQSAVREADGADVRRGPHDHDRGKAFSATVTRFIEAFRRALPTAERRTALANPLHDRDHGACLFGPPNPRPGVESPLLDPTACSAAGGFLGADSGASGGKRGGVDEIGVGIVCGTGGFGGGPIELSLKRAVEVAVSPEGNTRIQLSGEALKQAQSRSAQARAALLPDFEASLTDRDQTANLAAMASISPCPFRAFSSPRCRPFTTMDARATVTQSVFDFSSIKRFQASRWGFGGPLGCR